ncbi:hypothetical protein FS837_012644 [Tulasnella sp. UAMH 9824]|nr:hypothetical protein FS837_012644 [Tulasnella sp. UAMH 9824]
MDILKDIVQVLATTALLWVGRPPSRQLLSQPTPTQPFDISIPTVTVYAPSRCLPLPSYSSMPGASVTDAQTFLLQLLVLFVGLSIFGFFSLALGAFCLSLHGTQDPSHLRTSPPSEASPTVEAVEDAVEDVAEARTEPEEDNRQIIQELQAKIQDLEGQITVKATEIESLKSHHESQLTAIRTDLERQKSQWAADQLALEVQGQNTAADLHAKITQLEEQAEIHNATIEQITARHHRELEAVRSTHHSTLQTLTADHEAETTSLATDLAQTKALATRLDTDLNRALNENQTLESSNARLHEVQSSQSTAISKLKAQLEETSNQLEDAIQEKASVQDRLATAEAEVESISTRLYDASMVSLSPTSSPSSLRRRHSVTVIIERAKQVLEEVATATTEDLGVKEAAVEQVVVQKARRESPEPSGAGPNESETSYPEEGLSASMWATSQPPVKDEPPSRPDWASEAAARKATNKGKNRQNASHRPKPEQGRRGNDPQSFATFSTSERLASGKGGRVKTTRNSHKDVRHISKESDYKYHDHRS